MLSPTVRISYAMSLLICLLWLISAALVSAQPAYVEDFSTTAFEHTAYTSADWDTIAGELKLFPFTPALSWNYDSSGNARNVDFANGYLYLANGSDGLEIYVPGLNTIWGSYNTAGYSWDVTVQGEMAYVADGAAGLRVIDISDPTAPALLGTYDSPSYAYGVAVDGGRAYLCDGYGGLIIFSVSNPAAPSVLGTYTTAGSCRDIKIAGDLAYVTDGAGSLLVLDVSTPGVPTLVGTAALPTLPIAVDVAGDYAFVATQNSQMVVVDITDPTSPTQVAAMPTSAAASLDIVVEGDRAFVASSTAGLQVFDISTPTAPVLAGVYDSPGSAFGLCVEGNSAYLADDTFGVSRVQVGSSVAPVEIGSLNIPGSEESVVIDGNYAYVVGDNSGLRVIDLSDPVNPALAGTYSFVGHAEEIALAGDYAYVAGNTAGLLVFDISNPSLPVYLTTYPGGGSVTGVAAAGGYLYLADGGAGLRVMDVSNPALPVMTSFFNTAGTARDLRVVGKYAYVLSGTDGLQIVDVSNPYAFSLVGSYNTPGFAEDIQVMGSRAYIADGPNGLQILDISNPSSPTLAESYSVAGYCSEIRIVDGRAYLASGTEGIYVFTASNLLPSYLLYTVPVPGYCSGLTLNGQNLYATDLNSGLRVIKYAQSDWDMQGNSGWSKDIDGADDIVYRARLSTTQVGDVTWRLSSEGGPLFNDVLPDNQWTLLTAMGSELVWTTTHGWVPGTNSAVSLARIEWLNEFARIQSVVDIPNDQGGQVRLEWLRSGHDFVGDAAQTVEYAVYRKVEPGLVARAAAPELDGQSALVQAHALQALGSGWDFVTSVPVRAEDFYSVVVPTLADSSITGGLVNSTFMVTALMATPGVFFDSYPDSGYSVDNLAPGVPAGLNAAYAADTVVLDWNDAEAADFRYFRIYRDTTPGFVPSAGNLIHETAVSNWTDTSADSWNYHYLVTALDFAGNESDAAAPGTVSGAQGADLPNRTALLGAAPNPFNPSTTIAYALSRPELVRISVFDLSGRLVNILVGGEKKAAGAHTVTWNGRDSAGRSAATGVYFYRLEAGDVRETKSMTLIK